MLIRTLTPSDHLAVEHLLTVAFAKPVGDEAGEQATPIEVGLNTALLASDAYLAPFAIVAEIDGVLVGYCISTRGWVDDEPALGLGPIGVLPELQGRGIGSALVRETARIADQNGEGLIALLGEPDYYGRFGFVPSTSVGIAPPEPAWGDYFQALRLADATDAHRGAFRYASPFDDV
ncbi:MAG: N-acetyltransferase [Leifsonia sp.]